MSNYNVDFVDPQELYAIVLSWIDEGGDPYVKLAGKATAMLQAGLLNITDFEDPSDPEIIRVSENNLEPHQTIADVFVVYGNYREVILAPDKDKYNQVINSFKQREQERAAEKINYWDAQLL